MVRITPILLFVQFLGILVGILLLQIAAAVLGFVFSDLVTESTWNKAHRDVKAHTHQRSLPGFSI